MTHHAYLLADEFSINLPRDKPEFLGSDVSLKVAQT